MEIERKFLVKRMPEELSAASRRRLEQAYLCTSPVVRVRRDGEDYYLTYKGEGLMVREEYNLPLTREAWLHLLPKADGSRIAKVRYCLPFGQYTIELDVFEPPFAPLVLAEVEFPSQEEAMAFQPPEWFGAEVTHNPDYSNAALSRRGSPPEEGV